MVDFSCECGQTVKNSRPPDCVTCPTCGTKLIAVGTGEDYAPIDHHWCERIVGVEECKRCKTLKQ